MLRRLPKSTDPNLLVGFENKDDAGVFLLPDGKALVQTIDFFTPIVDDPYAYGQIAAANALSDVYAMGGIPMTVMNVACFNPLAAPADVWASILLGMHDKCVEAGAVIVGGHSVEDNEPKFGLSVTGIVDPERMFVNSMAKPGDRIYLTKPLGTGILTTAAKNELANDRILRNGIELMSLLNLEGARLGLEAGVRCATDITGFGLAGHLHNIARASRVHIEIDAASLPLIEGLRELVDLEMTTGGSVKTRQFLGQELVFDDRVSHFHREVVVDPQTSGGLALFSSKPIAGIPCIGIVSNGDPVISVK